MSGQCDKRKAAGQLCPRSIVLKMLLEKVQVELKQSREIVLVIFQKLFLNRNKGITNKIKFQGQNNDRGNKNNKILGDRKQRDESHFSIKER